MKKILTFALLITLITTSLGFGGRFGDQFTFPYSLFLKRDGSYPMLGNLDLNGYSVTNGTFSGVASTATYALNSNRLNGVIRSTGIISTGDIDATGYKGTFSTIAIAGSGIKGFFYWNPTGGIDGSGAIAFSTHTEFVGSLNITGGNIDLNGGELTGAVLASSGTYGEIYTKDSSSVTVISASETYTRVLGTSSADALCNSWFTGADNKLTYNYATTKHFYNKAEVTFTAVAKDKRVGFALFKNGVFIPGSAKSVNTNGAGTYNYISVGKCCSLSQGDYIEVYVINYSDDTDITVTDMRLTIGNKP